MAEGKAETSIPEEAAQDTIGFSLTFRIVKTISDFERLKRNYTMQVFFDEQRVSAPSNIDFAARKKLTKTRFAWKTCYRQKKARLD